MNRERLSRYVFPLRMALGVAILLLLIQHVDLAAFTSLSLAQSAATALVVGALVATTWIEAARLRSLVLGRYSLREMASTIFIAVFITNFTPTSIGGDAYKVVRLGREGGYTQATAVVLLERALGLGVLLAGSLLFSLLFGGAWLTGYYRLDSEFAFAGLWTPMASWLVGGLALLATGCLLLFQRRIRGFLRESWRALRRIPPRAVAVSMAFSTVLHTTKALLLSALLMLIGQQIDFAQAWLVLTFIAIAALLPVSVGGLGVREVAFVVALQPFAVGATPALFAGLVFRIASIGQAVTGAVLFTRRKPPTATAAADAARVNAGTAR